MILFLLLLLLYLSGPRFALQEVMHGRNLYYGWNHDNYRGRMPTLLQRNLGPDLVIVVVVKVTVMSCGDEHTAVVTQSGRLFTFGCNEWGQLGLGHNNNVIKPSCVKRLKPDQVVAVATGRYHTVVAMRSGKVWAMGCNSEGQLGVGRGSEWVSGPQQVAGLPTDVVQLAAGAGHSLARTGRGEVWVWGSNTEGQLGLGEDSEETVFSPSLLPLSSGVTHISCGYYHTALVTTQGQLLTFGEADGGKLGLSETEEEEEVDTDSPRLVNIPEPVATVECGASHTIALTTRGKVRTLTSLTSHLSHPASLPGLQFWFVQPRPAWTG